MDPRPQGRCPKRQTNAEISLGDTMKEVHQYPKRLQVEVQDKYSWQTAIIWTQIHGNTLTRGHLVLHHTDPDTFSHQAMEYPTISLHDGLSTGAY